MRPVERIDKFTKALNYIWKSRVPDWRFGQLFINVFDSCQFSAFHMEEDTCLEELCKYFDLDVEEVLREVNKEELEDGERNRKHINNRSTIND